MYRDRLDQQHAGWSLKTTEHQFLRLLDSAADGIAVRLMFYALPEVPRTDRGRRHISSFYSSMDNLWNRQLDGLIMTGCEPQAPNLRNEPYWAAMAGVIDWAEQNTHSAIWSCLAAHAAVLHRDGIVRRQLDEKRFGVFQCDRVSDHALVAGVNSRVLMPHSRWNDLPEDELTARGYRVLTRGKEAGVDMFVKQSKSLFIFFQGHPEYEAKTLLYEYRRDLQRHQRGDSDTSPEIPQGCSSHVDPWRAAAQRIYSNWLTYLRARKDELQKKRPDRESVVFQQAAGGD